MLALVRRAHGAATKGASGVAELVTEAHAPFLLLLAAHGRPEIRINALGMLAVLAALPATSPATQLAVGRLVLGVLAGDSEPRVVCEALDLIFDVFADGAHAAFAELHMMQALRDFGGRMGALDHPTHPSFFYSPLCLGPQMVQARGSRDGDPDTMEMLELARRNLRRFIRYKERNPAPGAH
ncbi:hypothetical protein PAPYR_6812 [Paratrimastix pyriformis]|uniref:SYO1-like TPR repeats domain-containing protein n=1 Tax=Paratrimastix pyriformis TaxID=342808 RepID=A0ABQ8UGY9_9EUKA|nr:hypothetical protein PAPYR_6812 [Paratrimastix pyriformis]